MADRICQHCNIVFQHPQKMKFCSHACYSNSIRKTPAEFDCKTCGRHMSVRPSKMRGGFCSYECSVVGKIQDVSQRFWSKIEKRGEDECWPFVDGYINKHGYGTFRLNNKSIAASRISYMLSNNCELDSNTYVNHRCDNPICCNPKHLYAGTAADNSKDMAVRLRQPSKLDHDDVLFVRNSELSGVFLSIMFNVSLTTIYGIKNGTLRKHSPF